MKRLIALIFALACASAFGTTVPIQLLNPTGSTTGQVITSTGSSTAPAWTTVTLSGLGGLAKANNLSDVASVSAARTNLGLTTAATTAIGTSGATIPLLSTANTWALAQTFTTRPIFNGATPWDSANLSFATPPAIGGTTPAAGAFTTLSATGLITPSSTIGVKGTGTNDSAQAGSVGEYVTNSATGVAITAATATNIVSVSLTAGDWDVEGAVQALPAASTTINVMIVGPSSTSATFATEGGFLSGQQALYPTLAGVAPTLATGRRMRFSLSATTTIYLVAQVNYSVSTCTANGFIRARRVR